MSMITLNVTGDVITGSYNGKNFGVTYSEELYKQMVKFQAEVEAATSVKAVTSILEKFAPLTVENFKTTIEAASEYLHFNEKTGQTFIKYNKVVSNVPIPSQFVDRLNESIEKNIDILPMVKFFIRTLRNPKLTPDKLQRIVNYISTTYMDNGYAQELMKEHGISQEVAQARATRIQVPITNEGLLQTYKVSKEKIMKFDKKTGEEVSRYEATYDEETGLKTYDKPEFVEDLIFEPAVWSGGDNFMCGNKLGYIIKVGEVHKLVNWDQVNCNDNTSCVKGLHVGNLDYIRGYQGSGTVTHNVFVDPMFIGSVPHDGTGVIRCKEYMVYDTFEHVTKSLYRSSTYAAQTDAEWKTMLKEAVKENKEFIEKVKADKTAHSEQLNSLTL
jgi:hypothetical protein